MGSVCQNEDEEVVEGRDAGLDMVGGGVVVYEMRRTHKWLR